MLTISFFYDAPDIDECESGIHNCPPDFICQNTLGSFRCRPKLQCKSGFIQDALGNCIGKTCCHKWGWFTQQEAVSIDQGLGQKANAIGIVSHVWITVTQLGSYSSKASEHIPRYWWGIPIKLYV